MVAAAGARSWFVALLLLSVFVPAADAGCHRPFPGTCLPGGIDGPNINEDLAIEGDRDPYYRYQMGNATFVIAMVKGLPDPTGLSEPDESRLGPFTGGDIGYAHVHVTVERAEEDRRAYGLEWSNSFGLQWTGLKEWQFEAFDSPVHEAHYDFPFRIPPGANLTHTHIPLTLFAFYGNGPEFDQYASEGDEWVKRSSERELRMPLQPAEKAPPVGRSIPVPGVMVVLAALAAAAVIRRRGPLEPL